MVEGMNDLLFTYMSTKLSHISVMSGSNAKPPTQKVDNKLLDLTCYGRASDLLGFSILFTRFTKDLRAK